MATAPEPDKPTLEQAIGQVLRKLRLANGFKLIDVSVVTDFAVTTLKNMEGGKQSMTIRSLDALAMFYRLPVEEIIIQAKKIRGDYA